MTPIIEGVRGLMWRLGQIAVVFGMVLALGALVYWIRVEKKGTLYELKFWQKNASHNLVVTYFHLVTSYTMTIISAIYILCTPSVVQLVRAFPLESVLCAIAAMTLLTALLEYRPYSRETHQMKVLVWCLHSLVMGFPLSYFGESICTLALLTTTLLVILVTAVSFAAQRDFYKTIEDYLFNVYYVVLMSTAACLLLKQYATVISVVALTVNLFGGMLLYCGVLLVNTQYFVNDSLSNEHYDPIYTSAVVYLCTLNLYIRMAIYHAIQANQQENL